MPNCSYYNKVFKEQKDDGRNERMTKRNERMKYKKRSPKETKGNKNEMN
jgi:hypothetical protein